MNMLIAEDDRIQRENLKKIISEIDKSLTIYEAEDKDEALKISTESIIDIFYIDIGLKNSSGLDLAIEIRKIDKYEFTWIVFLTTHLEYITQAFKEVHCYDYILNPYNKEELIDMSRRIILRQNINTTIERKYVVFDLRDGVFIKVYIDEIIFIEVHIRTCTVHTIKCKYEVKGLSLKQSLTLINSKDIIQCHKSFAVNINYITKIEKLSIKSYEIFFENYEENAFLSYKYKDVIIKNFKNNEFLVL
ncbi:LytR/AlgR family response regulator transcription factor [Clostridium estertheticum]|uniref:LytR/AlgR family response regulator transcription factor n=1 Tax=Clostridium estertheticum TaxID=238834 RepID=UPI001C7D1D8D|nr:LytTR family DNA-binding domain-containing protein [Clostridium estertheticum]MBX4266136.1 LytTR family DNA-binding domain-containing protein [Clostridium estertheticum]WLC87942.1 LytTR family DNA-binding domain-containing protein [Clostridium estertheticum]